MKQTNEQLLIELTKIKESHAGWVEGDERRRKEFAKAFNWYKQRNQYDYGEMEVRISSWEQIFIEIGKLLSAKNFMDYEGNISELDCRLEELERKIKCHPSPNLG